MASEELCELGDLPPSMCGCRNHRKGATPEEETLKHRADLLARDGQGWFLAQWPGSCQCGTRFHAGSAIRYSRTSVTDFEAECCG